MDKELVSWEDWSRQRTNTINFNYRELTQIACPRCGKPVYRRNDIVLTTYPAQYQYECDNCNWVGYSFQ